MRKVYRSRDIEVSFDLDVCIHVGECLRGDRSVFKLDRHSCCDRCSTLEQTVPKCQLSLD